MKHARSIPSYEYLLRDFVLPGVIALCSVVALTYIYLDVNTPISGLILASVGVINSLVVGFCALAVYYLSSEDERVSASRMFLWFYVGALFAVPLLDITPFM